MPQFAIYCLDKPDSLDLRLATRPTHVEYLKGFEPLLMAGPLLDAEGKPHGSLLVVEAPDIAAAKAFADGDPYAQAGLFASVKIHPFNRTFGSWS